MAKEVKEFFRSIIIAILAAGIISNFVLAVAYIPSSSMENTMMTGDRVVGSRLFYKGDSIKRGDVVIFRYGYTCSSCGAMYQENDEGHCPECGEIDAHNKVVHFTKRIIGVPGDVIDIMPTNIKSSDVLNMGTFYNEATFKEGLVMVNGKALDEKYIAEPMICDKTRYPMVHIEVPEGCYYMLGDNRNNSEDSRFWNDPFVEESDIIAKVLFCFYPFNDAKLIRSYRF